MVIRGFGMDAVDIERFAETMKKRGAAFSARVFTLTEARYCRAQRRPAHHFAARWAAKEAFFKALGTGWGRGGAFRDVEVVHVRDGAPTLRLAGKAQAMADVARVSKIFLTLSHTERTAVAGVLLAGDADRHW